MFTSLHEHYMAVRAALRANTAATPFASGSAFCSVGLSSSRVLRPVSLEALSAPALSFHQRAGWARGVRRTPCPFLLATASEKFPVRPTSHWVYMGQMGGRRLPNSALHTVLLDISSSVVWEGGGWKLSGCWWAASRRGLASSSSKPLLHIHYISMKASVWLYGPPVCVALAVRVVAEKRTLDGTAGREPVDIKILDSRVDKRRIACGRWRARDK